MIKLECQKKGKDKVNKGIKKGSRGEGEREGDSAEVKIKQTRRERKE